MSKQKWTHIGDGVYASFNGFHVILTTNPQDPLGHPIYLEDRVLQNLFNYAVGKLGQDQEKKDV